MRFTKRTNIALIIGGIVFLPVFLLSLAFIADWIIPSEARQALPASATDIHEKYDYSFNLQGDYSRDITARMPESEMAPFAKKMGLKKQPDGSYLAQPYSDTRYTAEYENGYLHYHEFEW